MLKTSKGVTISPPGSIGTREKKGSEEKGVRGKRGQRTFPFKTVFSTLWSFMKMKKSILSLLLGIALVSTRLVAAAVPSNDEKRGQRTFPFDSSMATHFLGRPGDRNTVGRPSAKPRDTH